MSRHRALAGFAIALTAVIGSSALAIDRFPMSGTMHAQSTIYEPGASGVSLPVAVYEVKPEYTRAAMQAKIQGAVWMSIVVNDTGEVADVQVSQSLDSEFGLDQEAVDAAWQWKFKPGAKDGHPVAVRVTVEMRFTLR